MQNSVAAVIANDLDGDSSRTLRESIEHFEIDGWSVLGFSIARQG